VSQSAIQRNEEARAYYEEHRGWKGTPKSSNGGAAADKQSSIYIKFERNEDRARQRYLKLSKHELVNRLIYVEHAYAEREEIWLRACDEELHWQLRAEEAEAAVQGGTGGESKNAQTPTLPNSIIDARDVNSTEPSKAQSQLQASTSQPSVNHFDYFSEIEEAFIRRRGKHLFLSPIDWALMESWKENGVPLHVVLRGIEAVFDAHDARRQRRSIKTLLYCREEVEAQHAEWLQAQLGSSHVPAWSELAGGESAYSEEGLPFTRTAITDHIAKCRGAILKTKDEKNNLPKTITNVLAQVSDSLAKIGADFANDGHPNVEELEAHLNKLETQLDDALLEHLPTEHKERQFQNAEQQIRPYAGRMNNATYKETIARLIKKILREDLGIPQLSLFYL
jgi:hypothetical protein